MKDLIEQAKQLATCMRYCAVDANDCGGCSRMLEYKGSIKCIDDLLNNAASVIEALAAKVTPEQKWIPVTERLPELHLDEYEEPDGSRMQFEVSCDQWVYTASRDQTRARYETGPVFQGWVGKLGETVRDVTHWKPLPEPPEEVQK